MIRPDPVRPRGNADRRAASTGVGERRHHQRIGEAGFVNRVMFGSDHWEELIRVVEETRRLMNTMAGRYVDV